VLPQTTSTRGSSSKRSGRISCSATEKLPAGNGRCGAGRWRWALYEVETPELAVALAERGADFVETMAVSPMIEGFKALARNA